MCVRIGSARVPPQLCRRPGSYLFVSVLGGLSCLFSKCLSSCAARVFCVHACESPTPALAFTLAALRCPARLRSCAPILKSHAENMSGAGRGVIWNTPNTDRPDQGRGVPFPAREDTPGPVVYRILNGRLAEVGAYAKTPCMWFQFQPEESASPYTKLSVRTSVRKEDF